MLGPVQSRLPIKCRSRAFNGKSPPMSSLLHAFHPDRSWSAPAYPFDTSLRERPATPPELHVGGGRKNCASPPKSLNIQAQPPPEMSAWSKSCCHDAQPSAGLI